jgi:hypothetical protein
MWRKSTVRRVAYAVMAVVDHEGPADLVRDADPEVQRGE